MNPTASCFEIVHFAFQAAVPLSRQIESMKTLGHWAATQPGFLSRQSYHDPQANRWTDVVEWARRDDALAAMERSQHEPLLAGVMALIAPESVHAGHHDRLI